MTDDERRAIFGAGMSGKELNAWIEKAQPLFDDMPIVEEHEHIGKPLTRQLTEEEVIARYGRGMTGDEFFTALKPLQELFKDAPSAEELVKMLSK